ncbi:MAG: hypothetical protein ACRD1T_09550 [Acidimicrobiia bacterium]
MVSSLQVTAKHGGLQVFLLFTKPVLEIDGKATALNWGDSSLSVSPGRHRIAMYFPYFGRSAGKAEATIDVPQSGIVRLPYITPVLVTSKGRLDVE